MLLGDGCCWQHRAGVGKGRTVVNHCFGCGGMGNPMGRQEGTAGGGAALGGGSSLAWKEQGSSPPWAQASQMDHFQSSHPIP